MVTLPRRFAIGFVVLGLVAGLHACGGDGGPSEPEVNEPPGPDTGGGDTGGGGAGGSSGATVWSALYGGEGAEEMEGITATADGGYVVVGTTASYRDTKGDAWVVKVDASGNVVWQKTYGGAEDEYGLDVKETVDGGLIVAGWTRSFGAGEADMWLLRLNAAGDVQWSKTYGGAGTEQAWSVDLTRDGGYVIAGGTTSFGAGMADLWVLKLDAAGEVVWQKAYGGPLDDAGGGQYGEFVGRLLEARDGNLVAVTDTYSFGQGEDDIWALKLSPDGSILWQKTYGGKLEETLWSFHETPSGGFVLPGSSVTYSPDESGDLWALGVDGDGAIQWQKLYALSGVWFEALAVTPTADGGSVVGAYYEEGTTDWDYALLRLDGNGSLVWQRRYEYGWDWPNALVETSDGRLTVAGVAWDNDRGAEEDLWVMRTDADGTTGSSCSVVQPLAASPVETSAVAADSDATVTDTNVSAQANSPVVQTTPAAPSFLCSG